MTFEKNETAPSAASDVEINEAEAFTAEEYGSKELPCANNATDEDFGVGDVYESVDEKQLRQEYERLMKTRFKEFYAEDTQRIINKRFRKYHRLEERVRELEEERETSRRNHVDDAQLDELILSSIGELATDADVRLSDGIEKDPTFRKMARIALETGEMEMRDAYRLAYFDRILADERKRAAQETERRIQDEVRSRRRRPVENATVGRSSPAPFDVARLTRDEREKLARRAQSGERIKLG